MSAALSALHALSFGSPLWLWGLWLLPAFGGLFLWAERLAVRRLERLIPLPRLRTQLTGAASVTRRGLRHALLLAGLAALLLAMAGPRLGYETLETHRRGLDLILIVDVSKSMLATDILPNRLTRARLSVQDLIPQLTGDRLGLVAFAGSAFLQAPLTVDYDAVLDAAAELDTDLIPRGGTNLGGAIELAVEAFGKAEAGNRAIVLLSDGEPTSDGEQADGIAAAGRAAAAGVTIYTVGLGTADGSLIPLDRNGTDFVRDEDGKIVRTRLNESGLREIAKAGNGFYMRFTSGEAAMHEIVARGLSQLKAGEIDARTDRRPIERYQWPLGAGLLLLAWGALIGERRRVRNPSVGSQPVPARKTPVAVAAVLAAWFVLAVPAVRAEAAAPAASADGALELYHGGHYDEAYRAFEELAKKNPDAGGLQFNAGASAYMGKQYDEALDAFGHALTTDNPDLQAKSHYNFGNTLFKRGEEQKDRDAKIKDWKNAIQHYNSTLETLKRTGKDNPLVGNTAYNLALVKKRLDEEMEQPPPPPKQNQKGDKGDKQDKQDKQNQQGNQGKPDQQDKQNKQDQQGKQDQPGGKDQQDQQGQQPDQQNPSSSPQNKPGQENKPDQQNPSQNGRGQQGHDQSPTSGKPSDQKGQGADQPPPSNDSQSSGQQPPDPSSLPNQDKLRQRGDFQSQLGKSASPEGSPSPTPGEEAGEAKEEAGKMSPAQARALLDSLKGEDDRVMLDNHKHHDEPVTKDW